MPILLLLCGVLLVIVGLFVPLVPWGVLCFIAGGLLILFAASAFNGTRPTGRRWFW